MDEVGIRLIILEYCLEKSEDVIEYLIDNPYKITYNPWSKFIISNQDPFDSSKGFTKIMILRSMKNKNIRVLKNILSLIGSERDTNTEQIFESKLLLHASRLRCMEAVPLILNSMPFENRLKELFLLKLYNRRR